MSDAFQNINNQLTTAGSQAREAATLRALDIKKKAFEKKKSIEEGLSGFKAITSVKKLGGAFEKNISPYLKQEAKKSYNQFKDQWSKEIAERPERYTNSNDPWSNESTGGARPTNVEPTNADAVEPPIQMEELGEVEGDEAVAPTAEAVAPVADTAEVQAAIQAGRSDKYISTLRSTASRVSRQAERGIEPESDSTGILSSEIGEAGVSKVGSTLNPFNLGGVGAKPAESVSSGLDTIGEDSIGEATAARQALQASQSAEVRAGLQSLKDQQSTLNDSLSRLGNSSEPAQAGSADAQATADAAKVAEKAAAEEAEKKAAVKATEKTVETGTEDTAEITSEEAIGAALDESGIFAPLGLLIGAVGLGTAVVEGNKKAPKLNPIQAVARASSAYQSGIN